MAFQPASYLELAHELAPRATQDGPHLRALISRAYYAAFIVARDSKNVSSRGPNGHSDVINRYKAPISTSAQHRIGHRLESLRDLRRTADYEPQSTMTAGDGIRALKLSEQVLLALNAWPLVHPLARHTPSS